MTKKKKATAALAAVLAVALVAGAGSFAYLSAYSDSETNEFSINQDSISLEETTGNDYEITPGTYDQKDPIIYVDTDVDAYVYVMVWGNNPIVDESTGERALVYEYDEGWTELELDWSSLDSYDKQMILNCFGIENEAALGIDSSQGGFVTILYREVGADEVGTDYSILKGDLVKYNENITNEMMEAWKDYDIFLSFAGYIIESEPFANAEAALYQDLVYNAASLYESIEKHGGAVLMNSFKVDVEELDAAIRAYTGGAENAGNDTTSIFIDLNGRTLTLTGDAAVTGGNNNSISGAIIVPEGYVLNIIGDGDLVDSITSGIDHDYDSIAVEDGGELIMTDVTATLNGSIALEAGDSNGVIRLYGCDITVQNRYGVRGHADDAVSDCTSEIYLVNCTIEATGTYDESHGTANEQGTCGVLMNFPGKLEIIDCGTVEASGSGGSNWKVVGGISGTYQGVVIRAGEAYIESSVISQTGSDSAANLTKYNGTNWSTGNKVACGAVVIGTNTAQYTGDNWVAYDTDCSVVISGDTVLQTYSDHTAAVFAAAGAPGKTTSVTVEGNTVSHYTEQGGENTDSIKVGWILQDNSGAQVIVNGHSLAVGSDHGGVSNASVAESDNYVTLAGIGTGAYDA